MGGWFGEAINVNPRVPPIGGFHMEWPCPGLVDTDISPRMGKEVLHGNPSTSIHGGVQA